MDDLDYEIPDEMDYSYLEDRDPCPFKLPKPNFYGFKLVGGILVIIISVLGILGNGLMSVTMLRSQHMKSITFNRLLVVLNFFDSLLLLGSIFRVFNDWFDVGNVHYDHFVTEYFYPFDFIAMHGAVYMTVAIGVEKFTCFKEASPGMLKITLPVIITSIALSLPRFFERPFNLNNYANYQLYSSISVMIFICILPLAALACIMWRISKYSKNRTETDLEDNDPTYVCKNIIVVFLICYSIITFIELTIFIIFAVNDSCVVDLFYRLSDVTSVVLEIMFCLNSASKLLVYFCTSLKFRKQMGNLFGCKPRNMDLPIEIPIRDT